MTISSLATIASDLGQGRFEAWHGLPDGPEARVEVPADALPAPSWLGSGKIPASFFRFPIAPTGPTARVWLREGKAVLLELAVDAPIDVASLAALGVPDARLDLHYRLLVIPKGEWVFSHRGLSVVVSPGDAILHILTFVPTTVGAYERDLRADFETSRRPRIRH